jgi:hypothetical protein
VSRALDPATASVDALAMAMLAKCQSVLDRDNLGKFAPGMPMVLPRETVQFAAALLGVLDVAAQWIRPGAENTPNYAVMSELIRVTAVRFCAAGGVLEES